MEAMTATTAQQLSLFPPKPQCLMTPPVSLKLPSSHLLRLSSPSSLRLLVTDSSSRAAEVSCTEPENVTGTLPGKAESRSNGKKSSAARVKNANINTQQLKMDWLQSLSWPSLDNSKDANSGWVIGIDPDLSGALAVIRPDDSPQVHDNPYVKVPVGQSIRKRLDARSISQLLQAVDAPIGTTVYLEQSIPFPQDGKQGWWSSGFSYGVWIGTLVNSGYSIVPVPSLLWKNEFKLAGTRISKDDSREVARTIFPSMSHLLKRKKDHGRAEALLIAAYGKGLKLDNHSACLFEVAET